MSAVASSELCGRVVAVDVADTGRPLRPARGLYLLVVPFSSTAAGVVSARAAAFSLEECGSREAARRRGVVVRRRVGRRRGRPRRCLTPGPIDADVRRTGFFAEERCICVSRLREDAQDRVSRILEAEDAARSLAAEVHDRHAETVRMLGRRASQKRRLSSDGFPPVLPTTQKPGDAPFHPLGPRPMAAAGHPLRPFSPAQQ